MRYIREKLEGVIKDINDGGGNFDKKVYGDENDLSKDKDKDKTIRI